MSETESRPSQDIGQDEAHAACILDTRNLITNALKQTQTELAQINSISLQALQNAVENANLVAKNAIANCQALTQQMIAHRDIAIDSQWVTGPGEENIETK